MSLLADVEELLGLNHGNDADGGTNRAWDPEERLSKLRELQAARGWRRQGQTTASRDLRRPPSALQDALERELQDCRQAYVARTVQEPMHRVLVVYTVEGVRHRAVFAGTKLEELQRLPQTGTGRFPPLARSEWAMQSFDADSLLEEPVSAAKDCCSTQVTAQSPDASVEAVTYAGVVGENELFQASLIEAPERGSLHDWLSTARDNDHSRLERLDAQTMRDLLPPEARAPPTTVVEIFVTRYAVSIDGAVLSSVEEFLSPRRAHIGCIRVDAIPLNEEDRLLPRPPAAGRVPLGEAQRDLLSFWRASAAAASPPRETVARSRARRTYAIVRELLKWLKDPPPRD